MVVIYHPEVAVLDRLRALTMQLSTVIVVDNGSTGESRSVVEAVGRLAGIRLIRNASNLGIAAALNLGVRQALADGVEWMGTFDQDSEIPHQYFEELLRASRACPDADRVGMVVPGVWASPLVQGSGSTVTTAPSAFPAHEPPGKMASSPQTSPPGAEREKTSPAKAPAFAYVQAAITSGSLVRADVFGKVGFFDEALFIDYVDADFCLRLGRAGYTIVSAPNAHLAHELGDSQTRNLFGFRLSFRIHHPWRYYYIMRNRVVMLRRYASDFPRWAFRDAGWMFLELGRMAILESGRIGKLHCAFLGLWDGIRGRLGRHPRFPPPPADSTELR